MLFDMRLYKFARPQLIEVSLVFCLAVAVGGCREGQSPNKSIPPGSESDDSQIVAMQEQGGRAEITGKVRVYKVLAEDDEGLRHERFLVMLSNGRTVMVAHSIDRAPRVPVVAGDVVVLHGEFIGNEKGGVIHWTHHSDSPKHEGGWIMFNGKRYE
ncbi:MAG TPA: DUF3465 domain-containing protein [Oculatellaceae cyanobacterium]